MTDHQKKFTLKGAADLIGFSPPTFKRYMDENPELFKLSKKNGRKWEIPLDEIEGLVAEFNNYLANSFNWFEFSYLLERNGFEYHSVKKAVELRSDIEMPNFKRFKCDAFSLGAEEMAYKKEDVFLFIKKLKEKKMFRESKKKGEELHPISNFSDCGQGEDFHSKQIILCDLLEILAPTTELFIKPAGKKIYFEGTAKEVPHALYNAVVNEVCPRCYYNEDKHSAHRYIAEVGIFVNSLPDLNQN